jgi:drug/metabolite transporter (DMT)-like permease
MNTFWHPFFKTTMFTGLALVAFAANSVLCRLALGEGAIDAGSFTVIRLLSGAVVLWVMISISSAKTSTSNKGSWPASFMLFLYAVSFSFAYITLDTGTGALILFGAVQITMVLLSIISGTRLHFSEWLGITTAFTGFVYLVLPGVTTPSLTGFLLMTIAGIAWGIYTLMGRRSNSPLMDTGYNFFRTIPLAVMLLIATISNANYSFEGVVLAVLSGGIASGVGYTIWYMALRGLSGMQAAALQLLVPVIAALGGVIFVSEEITPRLMVSSTLILGGILVLVLGKYYFSSSGPGRKPNI